MGIFVQELLFKTIRMGAITRFVTITGWMHIQWCPETVFFSAPIGSDTRKSKSDVKEPDKGK